MRRHRSHSVIVSTMQTDENLHQAGKSLQYVNSRSCKGVVSAISHGKTCVYLRWVRMVTGCHGTPRLSAKSITLLASTALNSSNVKMASWPYPDRVEHSSSFPGALVHYSAQNHSNASNNLTLRSRSAQYNVATSYRIRQWRGTG